MTKTHEESGSGFHWTRSDNSFSFSFVPEGTSPVSHTAAPASETPPQASGFAFNFQIPAGSASTTMEVAPTSVLNTEDASQSTGPPPSSNPKKKKNNKKKGSGAGGGECEKTAGPLPESQQENSELTPEQQLNRELDWCIEQLELGLRTRKTTPKQTEEAVRALKTLRNPKAPLVKKRQLMRAVAGDYRSKMEQERDKQFKLIQSSVSSAWVKTVAEPAPKSVFHRKTTPKAAQAHTSTQKTPAAQTQPTLPSDSTDTFSFNVLPEGSFPPPHTAAPALVTQPQASGFAFNFQIPAGSASTTTKVAPTSVSNSEDASQSTGPPPSSSSSNPKNKKKKKGSGGGSANTETK
ncbi:UPF0488 protein C8orf33 homolog isoform X1 [Clupea harengus]|uniref:UPF0488 protein C8orf33 homolog isoform X1 n=2 Tax=Clupea harengus TaxID=7950 RepID=A0A6P3WBX5_CLUHA|nr:UPF0488 protein C8orf33 homolog isoform X1 [Clupea harengus]